MAGSMQLNRRDLGMVMREVDEDLAIFLGMRRNDHIIHTHTQTEIKTGHDQEEYINHNNNNNDNYGDENGSKHNGVVIRKASEAATPTPTPTPGPTDITTAAVLLNHHRQNMISNGGGCGGGGGDGSNSIPLPLEHKLDDESGGQRQRKQVEDEQQQLTPISQIRPSPSELCNSTPTPTLGSRRVVAARASIEARSRSRSRSSTPHSSSINSSLTTISASHQSSSSGGKPPAAAAMSMSKYPASSSRGTAPTVVVVKSRPSESVLCHSGAQNLKPSVAKRPASASRARRPTAAATSQAHSRREKSCSPAKSRATVHKMPSRCRRDDDDDEVNPVLMGTKMVNRVVNMRKLAPPPKQELGEYISHHNHRRKPSYSSLGFGRSLSQSSLDMAIRHMDIGRSCIGDNLGGGNGIRTGSSKSGSESPPSSSSAASCDSSKSSSIYLQQIPLPFSQWD
ncbi:uncharacterized protein LOC127248933 isoform X3 [Andrographis paniculata]|uniref:uncharacterized protein LOC127248933 isoform X3 n=1 Tax=Andrographis paniculata TaxID=175694 RepID=UPI0021E77086|nr:uncharacterized protein LOC127248933 isoform X3 [Andrographis paniculata]